MSMPRTVILLMAGVMSVCCVPQAPEANHPAAESPDTLDGTVAVIGTAEDARTVLRSGTIQGDVRLVADDIPSLQRVSGASISVFGSLDAERRILQVDRFTVREVDERPVADGWLRYAEGEYRLFLANGSFRVVTDPPAGLRRLRGSRVWIAEPLDRPATSFGLVTEAPQESP